MVGISLDITEHKEAEARERAAVIEAKSEAETRQAVMILAGSITHDIRTPLAAINLKISHLKHFLPELTRIYMQVKTSHPNLLGEPVITDSSLDEILRILDSLP